MRRPKLEGFTGIIDAILEADADPDVPRKQRHTAHRIFERLRDEHEFTGGYTIVKDYVRAFRQMTLEAFVPLHHPPGHAQIDLGEAVAVVRGQREKVEDERPVCTPSASGTNGVNPIRQKSSCARMVGSMSACRWRWNGSWEAS